MIELNAQYSSWYLQTLNKTAEVQALKGQQSAASRASSANALTNRDVVDFSDEALAGVRQRTEAAQETEQQNVFDNEPHEKEPFHIIEFLNNSMPEIQIQTQDVQADAGNQNSRTVSVNGNEVKQPRQLNLNEVLRNARQETRRTDNQIEVNERNAVREDTETTKAAEANASAAAQEASPGRLTPAQEDGVKTYIHMQNYSDALNLSNANSAA